MQRMWRHRDGFVCWCYNLRTKPGHIRHSPIPGPEDWGIRARLWARLPARMGRHSRSTNRSRESIPCPYLTHLSVTESCLEREGQCAHSWSHTQWIITVSWLSYSAHQAKLSSTLRSWRLTTPHISLSKRYQAFPLSVVEARSWLLSTSNVEINSWICTSTIPLSLNEVIQLKNKENFTVILYDRLLQPCFCTKFLTRNSGSGQPGVSSTLSMILPIRHTTAVSIGIWAHFPPSLEPTSDETRPHGISDLNPVWPSRC